jgi:hypothetical protein
LRASSNGQAFDCSASARNDEAVSARATFDMRVSYQNGLMGK